VDGQGGTDGRGPCSGLVPREAGGQRQASIDGGGGGGSFDGEVLHGGY